MDKPIIVVGGQSLLCSSSLYGLIMGLMEERRQMDKLILSMAEALSDYQFQYENSDLVCPGCSLYLEGQCFKSNTVADDNCLRHIAGYFKREWIIHKGEY